jgi:SAM-dependent methyltransferase
MRFRRLVMTEEDPFVVHYRLEGVHWWLRARRRIIVDAITRAAPLQEGPLVVDIGCGGGSILAVLVRLGYRTLGIDNNANALESARSQGVSDVRIGEAPEAFDPLPRGPYVFLLSDVLEHIEDDYGRFGAMVAAMPKGSKVVVAVPALMCLWSEHDQRYGHHRRYKKESLRKLLKESGLEVRFISYFSTILFPFIYLVRQTQKLAPNKLPPDLKEVNPVLNKVLEAVFNMERYLLRWMSFPIGSSLLAVAEKKK